MTVTSSAAYIAYRVNGSLRHYPITPSSTMAELADEWALKELKISGNVPEIIEMQSEGWCSWYSSRFASSRCINHNFHGFTRFNADASEYVQNCGRTYQCRFSRGSTFFGSASFVDFWVTHQDVMAARTTGFAMLSSASVQEAHDMALIAQATTLRGEEFPLFISLTVSELLTR